MASVRMLVSLIVVVPYGAGGLVKMVSEDMHGNVNRSWTGRVCMLSVARWIGGAECDVQNEGSALARNSLVFAQPVSTYAVQQGVNLRDNFVDCCSMKDPHMSVA